MFKYKKSLFWLLAFINEEFDMQRKAFVAKGRKLLNILPASFNILFSLEQNVSRRDSTEYGFYGTMIYNPIFVIVVKNGGKD